MSDSVVSSRAATLAAFCSARANDLRRVDDAGRDQVAVLVLVGVVAFVLALHLADAVDDDGAVDARVLGDVPQRIVEHVGDDLGAELLVAFELELLDDLLAAQQGHAAAGDDAFFQRRLRRRLWRLRTAPCAPSFRFGRGADVDLRHAAGQLGQPLLQLLAVVVAVGVFDLACESARPGRRSRPSRRRRR